VHQVPGLVGALGDPVDVGLQRLVWLQDVQLALDDADVL